MRNVLSAALLGAMFLATPALAQDADVPPPAPAEADVPPPAPAEEGSFNGIYIGGSVGYDVQPNERRARVLFDRGLDGRFGDVVTTAAGADAFGGPVGGFCNGRATGATSPTNPTAPGRCRNDKDGIAYYGRIGADAQFGRLVAGVVGEFGRSEINDSTTAFSTTPASYTFYREIDWEASIRGRLGFTPNNTTLFYAAGGPGYARINRAFFTTNTANAFSERGQRNQWGITAGGGVEQRLGRHFSIGLEYMFHHYNDDDYRVRATQGTAAVTNPFVLGGSAGTDFRRTDTKFNWHSIRATAAFRF